MKKFLSLFFAVFFVFSLFSLQSKASAAENISAGQVMTSSGRLNVRTAPSLSSSVKTSLAKGSLVTLIRDEGSFYYVRYSDSSYGYCHKSYINLLSDKTATVNTLWGNLNVRAGASVNYSVTDRLKKGTTVIVLSEQNGFCKVLYSGNKTGYVSRDYLKFTANGYKKINLSVPSFKQTDSRWANKIIGTSGKTIGKIGCATTSIAMIESYRQGCTIYPDTMAKRLSYSSTGNVYWPSHLKVTTTSADFLKEFYNILASGRPVLFGSKNYNGSQHWVVVTGFTGGEIKASNFTINDPGSNVRTTLSQFISDYPVFYKYFSY